MAKIRKYTEADLLFIITEANNAKNKQEAFKEVATALNRTPQAIQSKYYAILNKYPQYKTNNTEKEKEEKPSLLKRIFNLFRK